MGPFWLPTVGVVPGHLEVIFKLNGMSSDQQLPQIRHVGILVFEIGKC